MANSIYAIYHLDNKSQEVTLKVTIGKKQSGKTSLRLGDNKPIHKKGTFQKVLGESDLLDGQGLIFEIVCKDENPETNDLFATVELLGGLIDRSWSLDMTVNKLGSYTFFGEVKFRK